VQCYRGAIIRLEAARVIALPARVKPSASQPWSVTDDDRQRRQTPESKTILCGGASNNLETYNWAFNKCLDINTLCFNSNTASTCI